MRANLGKLGWAATAVLVILPSALESPAAAKPNSSDVAGYLANSGSTSVKMVVTSNVPTVNCSSSPTSSDIIEAAMDGYDSTLSRDVESGLDIELSCNGTTPLYVGQLFVNNFDSGVLNPPPSAGDSLTLKEKVTPSSQTLTLTDDTTGATVSTSSSEGGMTGGHSIYLLVQGNDGSPGFPPFSKVTYSGVKIGGSPLANLSPEAFNQVDGGGSIEIKTSPITGGDTFTATYKSNT